MSDAWLSRRKLNFDDALNTNNRPTKPWKTSKRGRSCEGLVFDAGKKISKPRISLPEGNPFSESYQDKLFSEKSRKPPDIFDLLSPFSNSKHRAKGELNGQVLRGKTSPKFGYSLKNRLEVEKRKNKTFIKDLAVRANSSLEQPIFSPPKSCHVVGESPKNRRIPAPERTPSRISSMEISLLSPQNLTPKVSPRVVHLQGRAGSESPSVIPESPDASIGRFIRTHNNSKKRSFYVRSRREKCKLDSTPTRSKVDANDDEIIESPEAVNSRLSRFSLNIRNFHAKKHKNINLSLRLSQDEREELNIVALNSENEAAPSAIYLKRNAKPENEGVTNCDSEQVRNCMNHESSIVTTRTVLKVLDDNRSTVNRENMGIVPNSYKVVRECLDNNVNNSFDSCLALSENKINNDSTTTTANGLQNNKMHALDLLCSKSVEEMNDDSESVPSDSQWILGFFKMKDMEAEASVSVESKDKVFAHDLSSRKSPELNINSDARYCGIMGGNPQNAFSSIVMDASDQSKENKQPRNNAKNSNTVLCDGYPSPSRIKTLKKSKIIPGSLTSDTQLIDEFDTEAVLLDPKNTKAEGWSLEGRISERSYPTEKASSISVMDSKESPMRTKTARKGSLRWKLLRLRKHMASVHRSREYERGKGRYPLGRKDFQVVDAWGTCPLRVLALDDDQHVLLLVDATIRNNRNIYSGCRLTVYPPWETQEADNGRIAIYYLSGILDVEHDVLDCKSSELTVAIPTSPYRNSVKLLLSTIFDGIA